MIAIRHLVAVAIALIAQTAPATTFDLLNLGLGLPDPQSLTVDGITLKLSGSGSFNSTAASFGIDSQFLMPDDPLLIDLSENLFFQFDQAVLIDSIVVSQFDTEDSGGILFKDLGVNVPLQNGIIDLGGRRLNKSASDRVYAAILTSGGMKGFSVDQIVVRAVPEPSTLALSAIMVLVGYAVRHRD